MLKIPAINSVNSLQIFQIMQFGATILVGVLLAQSGLPTKWISVYESLMFIASLLCFFWIVGGQNTLLQLYPKLTEAERPRALFNVFLLFTIASGVSAGFLILAKDHVTVLLTNLDHLPWLNLLSFYLFFHAPTFLIQYTYFLLKKFREIVMYGIVISVLQLIVVAGPVILQLGPRRSLIGLAALAVFKFIWAVALLSKCGEWKIDFKFLKIYLPLLLPLLLFAFIGKGSEYISGIVVSNLFHDDKTFAIYRYGAREFPLAVLMMGALSSSLLPEVTAHLANGLQRIKDITRQMSHWLFPLSMASMLAAPFVFPVIFNPDFKESARIFNIFTLLLSSRILMPQVVAMSRGKNYMLTLGVLIEMLLLAGLSWWWGHLFGLQGIAWAAVVAFMVDRIIMIWYNWKHLHITPASYIHWPTYIFYNSAMLVVYWISTFL